MKVDIVFFQWQNGQKIALPGGEFSSAKKSEIW